MIALSGVRSSCDIVARNSDFARLAASASVRAACSFASRRAFSSELVAAATEQVLGGWVSEANDPVETDDDDAVGHSLDDRPEAELLRAPVAAVRSRSTICPPCGHLPADTSLFLGADDVTPVKNSLEAV